VLPAAILLAHDFWIVPEAFQVSAGAMLEIRGQTGSNFPVSVSAVTPERIAEARLVGADRDEPIRDFSIREKSLLLRHRPDREGQYVVAVALVSRATRTTPQSLHRYIALEGNPALAERYQQEGVYPTEDSLMQVSAKYAKTVVEVGRGGARAFDRSVGHALEFVPQSDPEGLRPGDTFAVRLLYRGRPVAGLTVHAGTAGPDAPSAGPEPTRRDTLVVTGTDGIARIPVTRAGLWNVRTIYAAPVPGKRAEWEIPFATLVFRVAGN
jgi:hypothetical protein